MPPKKDHFSNIGKYLDERYDEEGEDEHEHIDEMYMMGIRGDLGLGHGTKGLSEFSHDVVSPVSSEQGRSFGVLGGLGGGRGQGLGGRGQGLGGRGQGLGGKLGGGRGGGLASEQGLGKLGGLGGLGGGRGQGLASEQGLGKLGGLGGGRGGGLASDGGAGRGGGISGLVSPSEHSGGAGLGVTLGGFGGRSGGAGRGVTLGGFGGRSGGRGGGRGGGLSSDGASTSTASMTQDKGKMKVEDRSTHDVQLHLEEIAAIREVAKVLQTLSDGTRIGFQQLVQMMSGMQKPTDSGDIQKVNESVKLMVSNIDDVIADNPNVAYVIIPGTENVATQMTKEDVEAYLLKRRVRTVGSMSQLIEAIHGHEDNKGDDKPDDKPVENVDNEDEDDDEVDD